MISIGILAYNEEDSIATTLRSLTRQTLLKHAESGDQVEVCVVANGCTDGTIERAQEFCAETKMPGVQFRVFEIPVAGKHYAWNQFVHELASPDTTVFVLMDADIVFRTTDTIEQLCSSLNRSPHAVAAAGLAYKDIELLGTRNPLLWLSARLTRLKRHEPRAIVRGQLTAYKAQAARQLWLPPTLIHEEGYIKDLLVSDFLTAEPDPYRILCVPKAGYVFQAYRKWKDIVATQARARISELQRFVLMCELRRERSTGDVDRPICEVLREWLDENPNWLDQLMARHVAGRGFWVMFPGAVWHRMSEWGRMTGYQRWLSLPIALAGTAGDLFFAILANRQVKQGVYRSRDLWTDTRSPELKLEYEDCVT